MSQADSNSFPAKESIDWEKVEVFIRSHIGGLADEKMAVQQFPVGLSNLTYFIRIGLWEAVLRRPPFGFIPPKAHDMEREYKILEKVNPVFPLAPRPFLFCADPSIMDKHFYIMEKKSGLVLSNQIPAQYAANEDTGRIISETVVNILVQLHAVDYQKAGLSCMGQPDGHLERQVPAWIKRCHNVKTDDIQDLGEIENWLAKNIPVSPPPTITHNDIKLNNIMLSPQDPGTATGVFDWELCTIGDPLTDLAFSLVCWVQQGDADLGFPTVTSTPGFFTRREFMDKYAAKSGRDISRIDFYMAFAYYKLGVIMQQMYYRWKKGEAKDKRFSTLCAVVNNLMTNAVKAKNKDIVW
jgi:aminoglycoside phosphotransferase (APT) family kinase protein